MKNMEISISLNAVDKVKRFVDAISRKFNKDEIDLSIISGRYVIDATSILGIFSLDLTKTLTLKASSENDKLFSILSDTVKEFKV